MRAKAKHRVGGVVLIWAALAVALGVPIVAASASPLLAWRDPVYIVAGFAGIVALALLMLQPMLVAGYLPGLRALRGRRFHRWIGGLVVMAVVVHVAGLWITSPPDVVDALLFASPTPFSIWGVVAMWALFVSAGLAISRTRLRLKPRVWRRVHAIFSSVVVVGSVVHAVQIDGTMETTSKVALCALILIATAKALSDLKLWVFQTRSRE